jgi:hypothetical protein
VSEAFLADFPEVWAASGKAAIERVAEHHPAVFVRVAASLLPKHFKHDHALAPDAHGTGRTCRV